MRLLIYMETAHHGLRAGELDVVNYRIYDEDNDILLTKGEVSGEDVPSIIVDQLLPKAKRLVHVDLLEHISVYRVSVINYPQKSTL